MAAPITRRTFLTTGAAAAGAFLPGVAAYAWRHPTDGVRFTLNAEVLDGGEQVTSITLHTARLGPIDPASLTTGTFRVHAKATSPIPIAAGDLIFSEYDLDRPVTAVRLDHWGNIVLDLAYGEGQVGGGTLGYIVGKGRNVVLDLVYTITQNAADRPAQPPLDHDRAVRAGRAVRSRGGRLQLPRLRLRHEVPAVLARPRPPLPRRRTRRAARSSSGCTAEVRAACCPITTTTTRRRCGPTAVRWASPREQAQRIFGGAYVVAPQSTSYWIEDGPRFAPLIREIIGDLVRRYPIDRERIYVAGCSNGGYMTMEMTSVYRDLFAAAVPICGVVAVPRSRAAHRCSPTPSCRRSTPRRGSSPRATTRPCRRSPTPSTPTTSFPAP